MIITTLSSFCLICQAWRTSRSTWCSVEPKRRVSKPTVYIFMNCRKFVINKLQTTVPNKKPYLYLREIEDNYQPKVYQPPFLVAPCPILYYTILYYTILYDTRCSPGPARRATAATPRSPSCRGSWESEEGYVAEGYLRTLECVGIVFKHESSEFLRYLVEIR